MDLRRNKYANYRYSNYMQDGLAVLKIGHMPMKLTGNSIIGKNNNTLYSTKLEFTPGSKAVLSNRTNNSVAEERSNLSQDKKPYQDKAIRTTKNYIGKSCYNVGRPLNI